MYVVFRSLRRSWRRRVVVVAAAAVAVAVVAVPALVTFTVVTRVIRSERMPCRVVALVAGLVPGAHGALRRRVTRRTVVAVDAHQIAGRVTIVARHVGGVANRRVHVAGVAVRADQRRRLPRAVTRATTRRGVDRHNVRRVAARRHARTARRVRGHRMGFTRVAARASGCRIGWDAVRVAVQVAERTGVLVLRVAVARADIGLVRGDEPIAVAPRALAAGVHRRVGVIGVEVLW